MKNLSVVFFTVILAFGCSTQKSTTAAETKEPKQGERGGRPSTDDFFKMDENKDGKLSKSEVSGPLQRDFSKIDSNGDGFITKEELENAPRPEKGQRPSRN